MFRLDNKTPRWLRLAHLTDEKEESKLANLYASIHDNQVKHKHFYLFIFISKTNLIHF